MPILSVIIVNWNRCQEAMDCVSSIMLSDTEGDAEIIVVDNGSSDGSEAALRERFPTVQVVQAGWNSGFAEGVNIGISQAKGDWIALVNNDATVQPGWAPAVLAAIRNTDDDIGMLQSHMLFTGAADVVNSTGLQIYSDGTGGDRGFGDPAGSADYSLEVFCPTGGAAIYRRAMLDQVALSSGTLDRRFFMYAEDADLGWRARLHGWQARYVPDAVVEHAFQGSSQSHGSTFVPLHCRRNRMLTLTKNASVGLIIRSVGVSIADLLWIAVKCGPRELGRTMTSVAKARGDRRIIGRRCVVHRRELESTWFTRPPAGHRHTISSYARAEAARILRRGLSRLARIET
jgi:N-acetylglucosaminyl-diphospho-decaprenol L-rhamnosyltransferase